MRDRVPAYCREVLLAAPWSLSGNCFYICLLIFWCGQKLEHCLEQIRWMTSLLQALQSRARMLIHMHNLIHVRAPIYVSEIPTEVEMHMWKSVGRIRALFPALFFEIPCLNFWKTPEGAPLGKVWTSPIHAAVSGSWNHFVQWNVANRSSSFIAQKCVVLITPSTPTLS